MTWRDDLRRVTIDGRQLVGASFRGVPFLVETAERTGGRRAVVHEFPLRNDPFVEDLGRRARTFRIDGYVIGDDYLVQRDSLLAALEDESGPGELVHPYHGVRRAICVNIAVRETRTDGGMAMFALEFAETPAQAPTPIVEEDPASEVASSADTAVTATSTELVEQYDTSGLPAFAIASAETALKNAANGLAAKLAPIITDTQELAAFTGQIRILTAQASSLVREPADVLGEFRAAIVLLASTVSSSRGAVMDALLEAYGVDLGAPVTANTATREREAENQAALIAGLRRVIAIEAARLAPLVAFASIEEAMAARDQIADLLDEQALLAADTAYPALVQLRTQVLRAVPGSNTFARVLTITRRVEVPSLVLAYQLYDSVDQEADVIARNAIRHPGFVSGELKVLSDGG